MRIDDTGVALQVCLAEIRRRAVWLVVAGALVAAGVLLAGLLSPPRYVSSVSIFVERQNIIDPLMAGRAVRTEVTDMAQNAHEGIYNRGLMRAALERAGRLPSDANGMEEENALMGLRARTSVTTLGTNLIRISYEDRTAADAFAMTTILADLFMEDLLRSKETESDAAFNFIDTQVRKYEVELAASRNAIQALRDADPSIRPGAFDELTRRQVALATQIDDLEQRVREGRIREASLEEQLSGEAEIANIATRAQQYQQRIAELRDERDRLRLSYHDDYPDIIQIGQQISELEAQLAIEEQLRRTNRTTSGLVDDSVRANPVYQQLQRELYDVRTERRTLEDRVAIARQRHEEARVQLVRMHDAQAEIERIQRDAQVNQDIYEDLLRRRENARVSRNLDAEQQGLKVRIQESAYLPQTPTGPTREHFVMAGAGLGLTLPLAFFVGLLILDPRLRHASHMPVMAAQSRLAVIPELALPRDHRRVWIMLLVLGVVAVLVLTAWLGGWLDAAELTRSVLSPFAGRES